MNKIVKIFLDYSICSHLFPILNQFLDCGLSPAKQHQAQRRERFGHHTLHRSAPIQWLPWPVLPPPHYNHQVYSQTKEGLSFLWLRKALTKRLLISGRYRRVPLFPWNCSRNVWSLFLETEKELPQKSLGMVWAIPTWHETGELVPFNSPG